jgi:Flp pilus assembly protein TadD
LLRRSLAIQDRPEARRLLAMIYAAAGNMADALTELKAWATIAPSDPAPHRAMAQVLVAGNRIDEALAEQRTVLKMAGSDANDWNDLGVLEVHADNAEEARRAFQHALQLEPANLTARENLARLAAVAGKSETTPHP